MMLPQGRILMKKTKKICKKKQKSRLWADMG